MDNPITAKRVYEYLTEVRTGDKIFANKDLSGFEYETKEGEVAEDFDDFRKLMLNRILSN
jgi:hypothetical protein